MNEETTTASRTLGQRIQAGRKAAGLSQETLGEKLEVSRQAVSKWESDAAVPELEKLIAMSRLFGVTVGALLGVEEGTAEESTGELTDVQLHMVEEITQSYLEKQPKSPFGKWDARILFALCGILLALIAGISVKIGKMDQNYKDLQSSVNGIQANVSGQIGSITAQISDILDENNNLLSDSSAEIVDFDPDAKTVNLNVSALPKQLAEGAEAIFTAELSDGRKLTAKAKNDGGRFTATDWVVPMDEEIQITAAFTSDGTVSSAVVATVSAGEENFEFRAYGGWSCSWMGGSDTVSLGSLDLNIETGGYSCDLALKKSLAPVVVDVCLFRNLETKPEKTFPVAEDVSLWASAGMINMSAMTGYETSVQLKAGDTVVAAVRILDNYGRTVCIPLDAWERPKTGEITTPLLPTTTYSDGSQMPGPWTPGTPLA